MIILIAGDTHTGKTLLAQRLLEKYQYPYLSIDHLKMGLIRSGQCPLNPESNDSEINELFMAHRQGNHQNLHREFPKHDH